MRITPSFSNTNFTARYRVLLTRDEFNDFKKNIFPQLDELHDGEVNYLYGKSPNEFMFAEALETYAEANGADINWAAENVTNSGSAVSKIDTAILWLTTGKKDCGLYEKFDNKCERLFNLRYQLAGFKFIGDNLDNELVILKCIDEALKKESRDFFKFIQKHPYQKMKNADEILRAEQQNLNIVL